MNNNNLTIWLDRCLQGSTGWCPDTLVLSNMGAPGGAIAHLPHSLGPPVLLHHYFPISEGNIEQFTTIWQLYLVVALQIITGVFSVILQ